MGDKDCEAAYHHAAANREEIERSELCGCFYCFSVYSPSEISRWLADGTAICPECTIDSVIGTASGFPINQEFLRQMRARWFGNSPE